MGGTRGREANQKIINRTEALEDMNVWTTCSASDLLDAQNIMVFKSIKFSIYLNPGASVCPTPNSNASECLQVLIEK